MMNRVMIVLSLLLSVLATPAATRPAEPSAPITATAETAAERCAALEGGKLLDLPSARPTSPGPAFTRRRSNARLIALWKGT